MSEARTHVDMFSGIGGFALAAKANGIETVQFVECDKRCRDFLSKAWQGVAIHDDIKTFNGTGLAGAWLLTAGVPCQPASCAGKQRGEADDRWLWPEALRVLREVAPAWCLFENPPGIGDLGLDGILSDVEAQGYEVEVLSIPACAVNTPHRRERYWIVGRRVADAKTQGYQRHGRWGMGNGTNGRQEPDGSATTCRQNDMADTGRLESGQDEPQRGSQGRTTDRRDSAECVGHAGQSRREGIGNTEARPRLSDIQCASVTGNDLWQRFVWLPCADGKVRRAPDNTFGLVDGVHRSLLAALGNSIVPQVAERVIAAMVQADKAESYD